MMAVLADILLFSGSLILYLTTLSPDILPADNGEFQLVAAVLGVAHPPGYPLHTVLGRLMTFLPIGGVAWRVNLLSAVLAAATLTLASATVRHLTGRRAAGLAAAMALSTSTTFWAQATMANVRTPTAFFTALGVYALVRYRKEPDRERYLMLLAAALSLGLTHHLSFVFVSLFFPLYLLLIDPSLLRKPRRWRRPALVAVLCTLPLLYLPLRSDAPLAPDNLRTVEGFFQHVLALGFSGDFFYYTSPADLLARLQVMGNVLTFQFHPSILVGAILGALLILRRDRRLALLLLGGFSLHTLVTATYRAPQTVEYMLPAYLLLAVALGYGLACWVPHASPEHWRSKKALPFYAYAVLVALIIVGGLLQGGDHLASFRELAESRDTRDTVEEIMGHAPQSAVVLADWHWVMPLRYLQLVEKVRPDLSIHYVYPTAEVYAETWARRIREELTERPVVVTHYDELAYANIETVFEPLGEAFLVRPEPRRELPAGFSPLQVTFGERLQIMGVRLPETRISPDEFVILTLAWSPIDAESSPLTLFSHLLGHDGGLYAQSDQVLDSRFVAPGELALTQFRLATRPGAIPGRYSLQIGAYNRDGALMTNSGEALTEIQNLVLDPGQSPPYTQHPIRRRPVDGLSLIGVDWDLSLAVQARLYLHWHARQETNSLSYSITEAGEPQASGAVPMLPAGSYQTTVHTMQIGRSDPRLEHLSLTFPSSHAIDLPSPRPAEQYIPFGDGIVYLGYGDYAPSPPSNFRLTFGASRPVLRDYTISASLIGLNPDETWAWQDLDDGIPAMGAIPTLKWIAGSRVVDPHELTVPLGAQAGRVIGTLIIYDAFTGRTLPVLDDRLAAAAPWAPLGEWMIQP
jgi:4-amino-4-deoxy-L-arabinose transferase-like glycosyltransferase